MAQDAIRLLQALFLPAATSIENVPWRPAADVYRTRSGWLVKFDLAGVRREEIDLSARGRCLTVRGQRRDWLIEEGACCYAMEIAYCNFERTLELPVDLDNASISAEHHEGILLVRIQTKESQS